MKSCADELPVPCWEAYMWWCGDEICDCTQPTIDYVTRNPKAGLPWVVRKQVWAGCWHSEGGGAGAPACGTQGGGGAARDHPRRA